MKPHFIGATMIKPLDIAKYIIYQFQDAGDFISNLKVQKLLYYVQGWHLGLYETPVFNEDFEAWIHGPVLVDVYHHFKHYKWLPITEEITVPVLEEKYKNHIDEVLNAYGCDSAWELELKTHREYPWIKARKGLSIDAPSSEIITKDSMMLFFKEEAKD